MNTANAITWADLARIKKAAKADTPELAGLGHAQRLDALARSEHGARHYHELLQRYEAHVASHVELAGAHHCRFCSFTFSDFDAGDRKLHLARHQRFEEAELALGFLPLAYRAREELKRHFGYRRLHADEAKARRLGALAILLAHYDRSLERAIEADRWSRHPCFVEYLSAALAKPAFLSDAAARELIDEFGVRPGVIAAGDTDWPAGVACEHRRGARQLSGSLQLRASVLAAAHQALQPESQQV